MLRYGEEELRAVRDAASRAGLTPSGFAATAALAAATGAPPPAAVALREVLVELMAARTQVRRFAVNVNQAVRALNATGNPPAWLDRAVDTTNRAVEHLDDAAQLVAAKIKASH